MKAILSKPYFVIPLALAGLLVNGALLIGGLSLLGRVFSPEAPAEVAESEQTPSQPAADVAPNPAPEPPMVTLQDALPVGYEAAVMAQTAKTEQEWYAVAKQWLAAIEILNEVPKTSPDYPAAKAKRNEYLKNFDIVAAKANAAAKPKAPSGDTTSPSLPISQQATLLEVGMTYPEVVALLGRMPETVVTDRIRQELGEPRQGNNLVTFEWSNDNPDCQPVTAQFNPSGMTLTGWNEGKTCTGPSIFNQPFGKSCTEAVELCRYKN